MRRLDCFKHADGIGQRNVATREKYTTDGGRGPEVVKLAAKISLFQTDGGRGPEVVEPTAIKETVSSEKNKSVYVAMKGPRVEAGKCSKQDRRKRKTSKTTHI